jgi:hypothetical protein
MLLKKITSNEKVSAFEGRRWHSFLPAEFKSTSLSNKTFSLSFPFHLTTCLSMDDSLLCVLVCLRGSASGGFYPLLSQVRFSIAYLLLAVKNTGCCCCCGKVYFKSCDVSTT